MAQTLDNTTNSPIDEKRQSSGWIGWIYFAGILMMLAGVFQIIAGLVAVFQQTVFLISTESLLVFDYSQWGWLHLIFGLILFFSSFGVIGGTLWGRVFGSLLAGLSAIANFALLPVHPVWSIVVIAIDVLIIYALTVHGSEMREM